jgi:hypothetical protein
MVPRKLNEIIASLPEGERTKIEARAQPLIAEQMSLQERRTAFGDTQAASSKASCAASRRRSGRRRRIR